MKSISRKFEVNSITSEQQYEIRVNAALDIARFLIAQGHAFHGHDESSSSLNKGNFLEMLDWYKKKNNEVRVAFDELCPKNARMTSSEIQKDLTQSCALEISKVIKEEIGGNLFSILIDESRDISIAEQMAVIVRFVNKKGMVVERFLGLKHVEDTTSNSLKKSLL
ncbi:zinc finger MYM-type protein 1-like [Panicum virgatum]|uniref:zinc finger MYM-type protein 1-like n=1 Tax=Panicum virgatum TaxID=38727 RepID=UPI0019D63385|nr:zinc finger MYM-type protein 1-like [Panicum virgatum]